MLGATTATAMVVAGNHLVAQDALPHGVMESELRISFRPDEFSEYFVGASREFGGRLGKFTVRREHFVVDFAHGIADEIDLTMNASAVRANEGVPSVFTEEHINELLDASVGLRGLAWRSDLESLAILVVPRLDVKFPVSSYDENSYLSVGDGQLDLRAGCTTILALPKGFCFEVDLAYSRRTGLPKDEWATAVKLDFGADAVFGSLGIGKNWSFSSTDFGEGPIPSLKEERAEFGLEVGVHLSDSLDFRFMFNALLWGRNTPNTGLTQGLALAYRF